MGIIRYLQEHPVISFFLLLAFYATIAFLFHRFFDRIKYLRPKP